MPARIDRSLDPDDFDALKAEVIRAAVELSDTQLLELAEALHNMRRLRRPGRLLARSSGWLEEESRYFS